MTNIKRIFACLLFILLFNTISLFAQQRKVEVGGIHYCFDGKEAFVARPLDGVEGDSYAGEVTVPASIQVDGVTYPVTGVDKYAFSDAPNLVKVTLPQSIKFIPAGSFGHSKSLKEVEINNSLYKTVNDVIYSIPQSTETTLDFTNKDRSYDYTQSEAIIHFPQVLELVSLSVNDKESQLSNYFSWNSGGKEIKVLRLYRDCKFTIASQCGSITKIEFDMEGRFDFKALNGTLQNNVWTGNAHEVNFVSNRRNNFKSIKVYTEDGYQVIAVPAKATPDITEGVTGILRDALVNNETPSIKIPSSVNYIGDAALSSRYFKEITFDGKPPVYDDNPAISADKLSCVLRCKQEYLELFKADPYWSKFKKIEQASTTGISQMESQNLEDDKDVYTLQGLRANTSDKGILIKKGKKFYK